MTSIVTRFERMVIGVVFPAPDFPANDTLAPAPHINIEEERTIEAVQGLGLTPSQSEPTALAVIVMNIIANIPPLAYW
jgi:hypothetical protein